ncbi:receptor-type tyrosine-protein phosphatase beta-like [Scyliorhinus canicula]|uniref:receptor-type tyrosine-protein phosphatase beta-like n=1 Tax=Scyliorhinus canicula TaxID=7830 RepID=UPI0018F6D419|nr:receptor-type tyrosine-protein phosphatase beta-like [Scyliorhinus canicula]
MEFVNMLRICLILTTLYQVSYCQSEFAITEITSAAPSKLTVSWTPYPNVGYYILDLRIVNNTRKLPFTVIAPPFITQKIYRRLRAGVLYKVTVKAIRYLHVAATASRTGRTVPLSPKLFSLKSNSSSVVIAEWTKVWGANRYLLNVKSSTRNYNLTFVSTKGIVPGLDPSTLYGITVFAANSGGVGGPGRTRHVITLVQPPSDIKVTTLNQSAIRLDWNLLPKAFKYEITVHKNSNGRPDLTRRTFSNFIVLKDLTTCTNYTISLKSLNDFNLRGESTSIYYTTERIKPVQHVQALHNCAADSVAVSWNSSPGATAYTAIARSTGGVIQYCSVSTTTCQIPGLQCSEGYSVTVIAQADTCNSSQSLAVTFQTKPCTPQNFQISRDCQSSSLWASWNTSRGAFLYKVTALASDGTTDECNTRGTSCLFTFFSCGLEYELKVVSISRNQCESNISDPITVRTAPCIPQDVKASTDCLSNILTISWTLASGALSYKTEVVGTNGDKYNCSSSTTSCVISGLPCGIGFIVFVIAFDNHCDSGRSYYDITETAPCQPQDVHTRVDCDTNTAVVLWSKFEGAISHIVSVNGSDGTHHLCTSMDTNCWLPDLKCGQEYSAVVSASNYKCNSSQSTPVYIKTGPCLPQDISAHVNCNNNAVLMTWHESQGALAYSATVEGSDGTNFSCNATDNSCEIADVKCGLIYNFSVVAKNDICNHSKTAEIQFNSAPCIPQNVNANLDCATATASVSWDSSAGAMSYIATVKGSNGMTHSCNTQQVNCEIKDLLCGQEYYVTARALDEACESNQNTGHVVVTNSDGNFGCHPRNITTNLSCENNALIVTWTASHIAGSHNITVQGRDGYFASSFSTTGTSWQITNLQCGQMYNVSIKGTSNECRESMGSHFWIETAPCVPQAVNAQLDCATNVASVSWDSSAGALWYIATAVGGDGLTRTCHTRQADCEIKDLLCGQEYSIMVTAFNERCHSNQSSAVNLERAPCPPQISAYPKCQFNSLSVSWAQSDGATSYCAVAETNDGHTATCNTKDTECEFAQLLCGHTYSITVKAANDNCVSSQSSSLLLNTEPCVPQIVDAHVDCQNNSLFLFWEHSDGAISYVATAEGRDGHTVSCSTADLNCVIADLGCGQHYNLSVLAMDETCNSTQSSHFEIETAPCDLQNVTAYVDCETRTTMVSWDLSHGALTYIATAEATDGHVDSCMTTGTNCELVSVECGHKYTVTVLALNDMCNISESYSQQMETAPCAPGVVEAVLQCESNTALVTWEESDGAELYAARAQTDNGHTTWCNTTETHCDLPEMWCGQTYEVTVKALSENCGSNSSHNIQLQTAPCAPQHIDVSVACDKNSASVHWGHTDGAQSYFAIGEGGNGHNVTCNTSDTFCEVQGLHCGQEYSFTVKAANAMCESAVNSGFRVHTAPCLPTNVTAVMHCNISSATISWGKSQGAASYIATARNQDGEVYWCNTSSTHCEIGQLHCSHKYTITVKALDGKCHGVQSDPFEIQSAPCAPQDVEANLNCATGIVLVSWNRSTGAVLYIATAEGNNGLRKSCSTTNRSCEMSDLTCGQTYTIVVIAQGQSCDSTPSRSFDISTEPCTPQNVDAALDCTTNIALVSWNSSNGSGLYTANAAGRDGQQHSCITSNTWCEIIDLHCDEWYNVTVTAHDDNCNSLESLEKEIKTAPCDPINPTAYLDCDADAIEVFWDNSDGAVSYAVVAENGDGLTHSCNTTDTYCELANLQCGQIYNISIIGFNEPCNTLRPSKSFTTIETAPCAPLLVDAHVDCALNAASLEWMESDGADSYIAFLEMNSGDRLSCNTTDTSCRVFHLPCGESYSVTVMARAGHCSSAIPFSKLEIQSVPCPPQKVEAYSENNTALISWDPSNHTVSYIATAEGSDGDIGTCTTSGLNCQIPALHCSQTYAITVQGFDDKCNSKKSSSYDIGTAPCAPGEIAVNGNY